MYKIAAKQPILDLIPGFVKGISSSVSSLAGLHCKILSSLLREVIYNILLLAWSLKTSSKAPARSSSERFNVLPGIGSLQVLATLVSAYAMKLSMAFSYSHGV